MTLPMARELASSGIRVMTVAPGLFATRMMKGLPQEAQDSLGKQTPFAAPRRARRICRLGGPEAGQPVKWR
jgi:NAD(P)-dependent dehydrogenase (short-subunit alcohol dehydrogenase family)